MHSRKESDIAGFKIACEDNNEKKAFYQIENHITLLDFSGDISQNSLYWAICHDRLSIFAKILTQFSKPERPYSDLIKKCFPTTQEVLDNLFSILRITVVSEKSEYFKLIYPFWQQQLNPENRQQEMSKFIDLVQKNRANNEPILKVIAEECQNKGISLLLSKESFFSPSRNIKLVPELVTQITSLVIQTQPGLS